MVDARRSRALRTALRTAPRWLWGVYGLFGILLVAYGVSLAIRPNGSNWTWLDGWSVVVWEIFVCAIAIARGVLNRRHRRSSA